MKRDALPKLGERYAITETMIRNRANAHSRRDGAVFFLSPDSLIHFAYELIEGAQGAPWPLAPMLPQSCPNPGKLLKDLAKKHRPGSPPPDATGDTLRLNMLEHAGGFVRGHDNGREAYRILGRDSWHSTLREAIDNLELDNPSPRLEPR